LFVMKKPITSCLLITKRIAHQRNYIKYCIGIIAFAKILSTYKMRVNVHVMPELMIVHWNVLLIIWNRKSFLFFVQLITNDRKC
jgi:hypothetical protein